MGYCLPPKFFSSRKPEVKGLITPRLLVETQNQPLLNWDWYDAISLASNSESDTGTVLVPWGCYDYLGNPTQYHPIPIPDAERKCVIYSIRRGSPEISCSILLSALESINYLQPFTLETSIYLSAFYRQSFVLHHTSRRSKIHFSITHHSPLVYDQNYWVPFYSNLWK